jgi:protein SCO1/2
VIIKLSVVTVQKLKSTILLRISLVLVVFAAAFYTSNKLYTTTPPPLPFFDPADVNPDLVDRSIQRRGIRHRIAPFKLTDQRGGEVRDDLTDGKVYMADFFFASCPSICIDMAKQKRWLQNEMRSETNFLILSHTVMPEMDTVSVLAEYAELQKANWNQWRLLTGDRDSIYSLARRSYLVAKEPDSLSQEHDMIHTENFVLVDQKGRIRGFYDGTSKESVQLLAKHAKQLLGSK